METITQLLISKGSYEMALDIIENSPELDLNTELKEAEVMVAGKWPDRVDMPRLWREWILKKRQGTEDIFFYGNNSGWAAIHDSEHVMLYDPTRTMIVTRYGCNH